MNIRALENTKNILSKQGLDIRQLLESKNKDFNKIM